MSIALKCLLGCLSELVKLTKNCNLKLSQGYCNKIFKKTSIKDMVTDNSLFKL